MIAALYVQENGCYANLPGVDPWPESREARLYAGPWPVVAHPPCERWGAYWYGGPSARTRRIKGDDGGCFEHALSTVRRYGGVIEHPARSHAWAFHGLSAPDPKGGWTRADEWGGVTCQVSQGHYGHRADKPTWLYVQGGLDTLPELRWGRADVLPRLSARQRTRGVIEGMGHRERAATTPDFRDLLISLARASWHNP